MICKKCGKELDPAVKFCTGCGANVAEMFANDAAEEPANEAQPAENTSTPEVKPVEPTPVFASQSTQAKPVYTAPVVPPVQQNNASFGGAQPVNNAPAAQDQDTKPLHPLAYVGLMLLYTCTCCVGWVFMFVFAFSKNGNVNRKKFSQACVIWFILAIVVSVISAIFFGAVFSAVIQEIAKELSNGAGNVDWKELLNEIQSSLPK